MNPKEQHVEVLDVDPTDANYLRTGEVAQIFGVSERSVRQWADAGRLPCLRTPGGHRLFPKGAVMEALQGATGRAVVHVDLTAAAPAATDLWVVAADSPEIATPPLS